MDEVTSPRPVLSYDGTRPFLGRLVTRWRDRVGERVSFEERSPSDEAENAEPSPAVSLHEVDGTTTAGVEAILRAHQGTRGARWRLWSYLRLPGFSALADGLYRFTLRHDRGVGAAARWLVGRDLRRPRFALTRWLFLRALAAVALLAFVSWWVQSDALIGPDGISPAGEWLERVSDVGEQRGWSDWKRFQVAPTLLWLDPQGADGPIVLCAVGVLCSLLLFFNLLPGLGLLGALLCYLSLVGVGGIFMGYQWDGLLVESLAAGLFLVPWGIRPGLARDREVPRVGIWVIRLLMLKLIFLSGAVKLLADDPTWDGLSALQFHYWTQPLPSATSWYVHHLPVWMHTAACAVMLVIEVGIPWLILGPRRLRQVACALIAGLMLIIMATGNYGFFNLLTLALCVPLLDDRALIGLVPLRRWREELTDGRPPTHRALGAWPRRVLVVFAALILLMSVGRAGTRLDSKWEPPEPIASLNGELGALRLVNSYGLFADMTEERPEIFIEGSHDGKTWQRYDFAYKPDGVEDPPIFTAPGHMPRLDWQLWFAALGANRALKHPQGRPCQGWIQRLLRRLLRGSSALSALMYKDPFEGKPPKFIRTMLVKLEFASPDHREATGAWWVKRGEPRVVCPVVTLVRGRLRVARKLTP